MTQKPINKFKIFFLLVLNLLSGLLYAQETTKGVTFNPEAYQKAPTVNFSYLYEYRSHSHCDELPLSYSLKHYTPKVGHQKRQQDALGWAIGYHYMTTRYALTQDLIRKETINKYAFSNCFINEAIQQEQLGENASIEDVGQLLQTFGIRQKRQETNLDDDCNNQFSESSKAADKRKKIKFWATVYDNTAKNKSKIYKIKRLLAEGYPVLGVFSIRQNFLNPKDHYWRPNEKDTTPIGNHPLVIIGYNDAKQSFEVMNSWGNSWGNEGYLWIKYKDLANHLLGAYIFDLEDNAVNESSSTISSGRLKLAKPIFNDNDDNVSWENIQLIYTDSFNYELAQKDWEVGDMYRLQYKGLERGNIIYVFSLDKEGINFHFPQHEELSAKFDALHYSPHLIFKEELIVPPENDKALVKRVEGNQYIVFLNSSESIPDIHKRTLRMQKAKGTIIERFLAGFSDVTVPLENINYNNDKIRYSHSTRSDKFVIPIIITLE